MQLTRLVAAALIASLPTLLAHSAAAAVTEENFHIRTTSDLVSLCSADAKDAMGSAALNFCQGFAEGAVSVEIEVQRATRRAPLFCFPTPVPERMATLQEFVKWGQATPAHMQEPAADGLFAFLRERFPCGKK